MTSYPTAKEVADELARVTRIKRTRAWIQSPDPDRPGNVWVLIQSGNQTYRRDTLPNRAIVSLNPATPVKIGLDSDGNLAVLEPDILGQLAQGIDPGINNPANNTNYGTVSQGKLKSFYIGALGTNDSPTLWIMVYEYFYYYRGSWHLLNRQPLDLTTYIPAANTHCMVLIYLKTDGTMGVSSSTPQNLADVLDETDCDEATAAASDALIFGRFFRLYGGQTNIKEVDSWRDARMLIDMQAKYEAEVDTANATPTTIVTLTIPEASAAIVTGRFAGAKLDYAAACGGTFTVMLRRETSGAVTRVGTATVDNHEDSGGLPTLDVTSGGLVQVTGVAAEDWTWTCEYEIKLV
mgnify:CR=1 FL=1